MFNDGFSPVMLITSFILICQKEVARVYDLKIFSITKLFTVSISVEMFKSMRLDVKTSGFLIISGGIERDQWHEMG